MTSPAFRPTFDLPNHVLVPRAQWHELQRLANAAAKPPEVVAGPWTSPFALGVKAAAHAASMSTNPFPRHTHAGMDWLRGWTLAREINFTLDVGHST